MQSQSQSPSERHLIGCFVAAAGATLLAFAFSLVSFSGVFFAFVKLTGLPDMVLWVLLALELVPVAWITIWTAGRAWHVENRLESGLDVDDPDFALAAYFRRKPE
jgi:hypothetical protein